NIAGQPIYHALKDNPDKQHRIDEIFTNTRDAAYDIIQSKGATYYGIAMGLVRITQAILKNQNVVLPVSSYLECEYNQNDIYIIKNHNIVLPFSSYLEYEYNQNDIYIGVPTLINRNGAIKVYETQLNSEESEKFENSAIILKDMQNKIKQLIA